jgi:hypothetical protein
MHQRQHGGKEVKIAFDLEKRKRPHIEDIGGGSHTSKKVSLIDIVRKYNQWVSEPWHDSD